MFYSFPLPYLSDGGTYFEVVRDLPWPIWLDSAGRDRFDIFVAQPVVTVTTRSEVSEVVREGVATESSTDPIALLQEELGRQLEAIPDLPFAGGVVGYWSYDLGRRYHDVPNLIPFSESQPTMRVGIYDWAIVVDHQQATARLISRLRYAETEQRLAELTTRITDRLTTRPIQKRTFSVVETVRADINPSEYRAAFSKVKAYLSEGDCYQVNLAQRFSAKASGDAFEAYRALRSSNPAPYAAYLEYPGLSILCASPERFLKVRQRQVETKPIKGTRPRSVDIQIDTALAEALRNHPKDRAENLMIVDLLRNDLSRSCAVGSVRTPKLFEVESFANVHHLVSTVEGRLADGHDALDVLRDCFPGGSITGAPKLRAMQIIEELETQRRGIYCGVIGYIGFDGNMDTNIAIRTMTFQGGELACWAGGGIVADSDCAAEYQETLDKASPLLALMRRFGASAS